MNKITQEDALTLLMARAEQISVEKYDGHLTIMRFTTNWKVAFGTPDLDGGFGRKEINALQGYSNLCDALLVAIMQSEK